MISLNSSYKKKCYICNEVEDISDRGVLNFNIKFNKTDFFDIKDKFTLIKVCNCFNDVHKFCFYKKIFEEQELHCYKCDIDYFISIKTENKSLITKIYYTNNLLFSFSLVFLFLILVFLLVMNTIVDYSNAYKYWKTVIYIILSLFIILVTLKLYLIIKRSQKENYVNDFIFEKQADIINDKSKVINRVGFKENNNANIINNESKNINKIVTYNNKNFTSNINNKINNLNNNSNSMFNQSEFNSSALGIKNKDKSYDLKVKIVNRDFNDGKEIDSSLVSPLSQQSYNPLKSLIQFLQFQMNYKIIETINVKFDNALYKAVTFKKDILSLTEFKPETLYNLENNYNLQSNNKFSNNTNLINNVNANSASINKNFPVTKTSSNNFFKNLNEMRKRRMSSLQVLDPVIILPIPLTKSIALNDKEKMKILVSQIKEEMNDDGMNRINSNEYNKPSSNIISNENKSILKSSFNDIKFKEKFNNKINNNDNKNDNKNDNYLALTSNTLNANSNRNTTLTNLITNRNDNSNNINNITNNNNNILNKNKLKFSNDNTNSNSNTNYNTYNNNIITKKNKISSNTNISNIKNKNSPNLNRKELKLNSEKNDEIINRSKTRKETADYKFIKNGDLIMNFYSEESEIALNSSNKSKILVFNISESSLNSSYYNANRNIKQNKDI